MSERLIKKISRNENYEKMVKSRNRTSFIYLTLVILLYFGFIFTLAFNKTFFYQQLGESVITYGVPIGVGVIWGTMILTIIYGTIVSGKLDEKKAQILKEVKNEENK